MKKFFAASFRIIYIITLLIYLSACLTPFLLPAKFWISALAGLVFPILFALVVLFFVIWLFVNWRWSLLALVAIVVSWQQLSVMAAYKMPVAFNVNRKAGTLRIMSWNVSSWGESNKYAAPPGDNGELTFDLIKQQDADILCFQEYKNKKDGYSKLLNISGFKEMGYPYEYFVESFAGGEPKKVGVAIFSKYPFLDTLKFSYGD